MLDCLNAEVGKAVIFIYLCYELEWRMMLGPGRML